MVAYEFYWRDETGDVHLIGILPERRKDLHRISNRSILNWVETIIGDKVSNMFFTKVSVDDGEAIEYFPARSF